MSRDRELMDALARQTKRLRKAERERRHLLRTTAFVGTLGITLVLPIIAGAYLGAWLDSLAPGYSTRWTLSLIVVGIAIGAINAYLLVRR